MQKLLLAVVIGMGLLVGTPARAELCDGAVVARVNDSGLNFIAQQIIPFIPETLTVPATSGVVVDWPLTEDDATVVTPDLTASLKVHSMSMGMQADILYLRGSASTTLHGPMTVMNPYVSFGAAECQVNLDVQALTFDVGIKLATVGGRISVELTHMKVDLDNDRSTIALEGCVLGEVLSAVTTFARSYLMGAVQQGIERIAQTEVPRLAAEALDDTASITHQWNEFLVTARLDGISTDAFGVEMHVGVDVGLIDPNTMPGCATKMVPVPPCGGVQPLVPNAADAMFSVALTAGLLNRGMHAAWQSGRLCIDSDRLENPVLKDQLSKLGPMLGLPESTRVGFSVRFSEPPSVSFSSQAGMRVGIRGMTMTLRLTDAAGHVEQATMGADLRMLATPWVEPLGNSVAIDLHHVAVDHFEMVGGDSCGLTFDNARLERFIADVVIPLVQSRLDARQISPSLVNVDRFVLELKQMAFLDGYMVAHVDAHVPAATGEQVPPETILREGPPGNVVGPRVMRLLVGGQDNATPSVLLRYQSRINDGAWTEPCYGGRVDVVISEDVYSVEVAAVDQDGNVDPTPLSLRLTVDATLPTLEVNRRPSTLEDSRDVGVVFTASDDRTPWHSLVLTAQLHHVPDGGGMPELVNEQVLPAGSTEAHFTGLARGIYKIRVIVSDEVGNVTSADVGFVVEVGTGCSVAHTPSTTFGVGLVLLLLALVRSRLR
ncbi:MAG: hypothetical protein JRH20_11750 [Deltaproteobacteria bacterium]|nr:hypothetical protein [Deltaproteobacteria bacterium]